MNKKLRTEAVDFLFDAVLSLKNKEECYVFFEDICTINELLSLSQRFEVAKMLREQKTYLEVMIWCFQESRAKIKLNRTGKRTGKPVLF